MYLKPFAHAITAPANQIKSDKSVSNNTPNAKTLSR